jgi:cyclopropane fatty-acyl-phospholipid synthase-like methyltransferase
MVELWDDNIHVGFWPSPVRSATPVDAAAASDRLTDLMTDQLQVAGGARVLDIGCGLGKPARRLARRTGASVVGISISRPQLAEASALAAAEGLADRVGFAYADMMALPHEDGAFDGVLAMESVYYIRDRRAVLRGIARVLRPGGRLVLTDFFEPSGSAAIQPYPRLDEYPSIVADAGLELLDLRDLTAHVAPTYQVMLDRLSRREQELTSRFGQPAVDRIRDTLTGCVDNGEPNYLLMTARRPMF